MTTAQEIRADGWMTDVAARNRLITALARENRKLRAELTTISNRNPRRETMDLATLEADAREIRDRVTAILEHHVPQIAEEAATAAADAAAKQAAADAESNDPLITAARSAVHLSPAIRQALASTITQADADIAALEPEAPESDPEPSEPETQPETPADPPQAATEAPEAAQAPADPQLQTGVAV